MGSKNSTQYQPEKIVDHLRQQYPQLTAHQLQQLYTRLYMRNQPQALNPEYEANTKKHLQEIYQLINQQQIMNGLSSVQNNYQDRPTSVQSRNNYHNSPEIEQHFQQLQNQHLQQKTYNEYQPRNISNFQETPTRKQMEEQYQQRFQQNNFSRVDPPPPKIEFKNSRERLQDELNKINPEDAYRLFGINSDFNLEQLKKAYRKLSLQTHPDR